MGADELFNEEYAYFSSYSSSWVAHAGRYVDHVVERFALGVGDLVIEVAANDGYLLQFVRAREIPCLGIEPTHSTAAAARALGLDIVEQFFDVGLASEIVATHGGAQLAVANNVLAHVPDINGFVAAFTRVLRPNGIATFEFPHLLNLVEHTLFDTIYHEHFSYLSLVAVERIFAANGLSVFDVEELPTHGGSLRVFAQRSDTGVEPAASRVEHVRQREVDAGLAISETYRSFEARAVSMRDDFLRFLLDARREGRSVAAYGAAAKGNTLLNFAGVRSNLLPFVVDRNPAKQGMFLPGSRIPVFGEEALEREKPAYIVVFPWNLLDEVREQLSYVQRWGAKLVRAVPSLLVLEA